MVCNSNTLFLLDSKPQCCTSSSNSLTPWSLAGRTVADFSGSHCTGLITGHLPSTDPPVVRALCWQDVQSTSMLNGADSELHPFKSICFPGCMTRFFRHMFLPRIHCHEKPVYLLLVRASMLVTACTYWKLSVCWVVLLKLLFQVCYFHYIAFRLHLLLV